MLITWVLVVLVGTTVQTMQKVGWLPSRRSKASSCRTGPALWLGVYPTWQGLLAQAGAARSSSAAISPPSTSAHGAGGECSPPSQPRVDERAPAGAPTRIPDLMRRLVIVLLALAFPSAAGAAARSRRCARPVLADREALEHPGDAALRRPRRTAAGDQCRSPTRLDRRAAAAPLPDAPLGRTPAGAPASPDGRYLIRLVDRHSHARIVAAPRSTGQRPRSRHPRAQPQPAALPGRQQAVDDDLAERRQACASPPRSTSR